MNDHKCGDCLRWPECAGVAWGTMDCPETKKEKQSAPPVPAFLDDKTESGLLEED